MKNIGEQFIHQRDSKSTDKTPESNFVGNSHDDAKEKIFAEVREMILDKVEDINKEGIAYTCVEVIHDNDDLSIDEQKENLKKKLFSLFKSGILGRNFFGDESRQDTQEEVWIKQVKGWKKNRVNPPVIHFNIVGRADDIKKAGNNYTSHNGDHHKAEICSSYYMKRFGAVGLLFDPSVFKEETVLQENEDRTVTMEPKLNSYFAYRSVSPADYREAGQKVHDSEHGFLGIGRVAPRFVKGIVVNKQERKELLKGTEKEKSIRESIQNELLSTIEEIMLEVYQGKPELLVPVYNQDGDLIWPTNISYNSIVQPNKKD